MNTINTKTYRVEIVEIKTKKVVAVIGTELSEYSAEKRLRAGLYQCDKENFFVRTVKE